ncbi:PorT family protein [Pseudoflavitalea sp. X16]|uniref:porin family protein n=1 Tax=Paraflavitalea devenefica TaxID=2716334 RepID=UPI0014212F16|nr:porin family protein [Paraflavitalea devenefica]NII29620.1 PorT family protein [Paraflavitalea devenefica]
MKTKVFAFTAACLLGTFILQAQSTKTTVGGTTFGVRAGINFQNLNGEFLGNDLDFKLKTGFHIGVNAEIPIADEFYIQPGLLFSTKGANWDDDDDTKTNISYLELPVNFLYKPVLGTGKLLLGFGPYAGYAIGGKVKSDDGDVDLEFESELPANQVGMYFYTVRRFDFGANLLAGYEFNNKLSFQLNAQLGLTNISPEVVGADKDDFKTKNTGFGVSVGYRF